MRLLADALLETHREDRQQLRHAVDPSRAQRRLRVDEQAVKAAMLAEGAEALGRLRWRSEEMRVLMRGGGGLGGG